MKGFAKEDGSELKVQAIVKRLTPAVLRKDEYAIANGLRKMTDRYGQDLVGEAWIRLSREHSWLMTIAVESMPNDVRETFYGEAYAAMVGVIEDAGLRIEDHFRVSDDGFALTKTAVDAIAATGYPGVGELYAVASQSMVGTGLQRSPFFHPLTEVQSAAETGLPEDTVCLWGVSSALISSALRWFPDNEYEEGVVPGQQASETIRELVPSVAPTLDLETLMKRSRYDDRALLKLCELIHRALETQVQKAFESQG